MFLFVFACAFQFNWFKTFRILENVQSEELRHWIIWIFCHSFFLTAHFTNLYHQTTERLTRLLVLKKLQKIYCFSYSPSQSLILATSTPLLLISFHIDDVDDGGWINKMMISSGNDKVEKFHFAARARWSTLGKKKCIISTSPVSTSKSCPKKISPPPVGCNLYGWRKSGRRQWQSNSGG